MRSQVHPQGGGQQVHVVDSVRGTFEQTISMQAATSPEKCGKQVPAVWALVGTNGRQEAVQEAGGRRQHWGCCWERFRWVNIGIRRLCFGDSLLHQGSPLGSSWWLQLNSRGGIGGREKSLHTVSHPCHIRVVSARSGPGRVVNQARFAEA